MKRNVALSLVLLLFINVFTVGCSHLEEVSNPALTRSDFPPAELEPQSIRVDFWDVIESSYQIEVQKYLLQQFEVAYPSIEVDYTPVPQDQGKAKYDLAIHAGLVPDVGGLPQYWFQDFIQQEALYPLDRFLKSWPGTEEIHPAYWETVTNVAPNRKIYMVPHRITLPVLWYNTELLKEAEVNPPVTWPQVLAGAQRITDKEQGVYGFSLRGGYGASRQFEKMMYQHSGITEMFDDHGNSTANHPLHVALLRTMVSLYNKHTPESDVSSGYQENLSAFHLESTAMLFDSLGSYGEHKKALGDDTFGAVPFLQSRSGSSPLVSDGVYGFSVFKQSRHPEEAFSLVTYLCQQQASSYYGDAVGTIPCNRLSLQEQWLADRPFLEHATGRLLNPSSTIVVLPVDLPGYYALHEGELTEGFQKVLLEELAPQQYLDGWAERMTALYKQHNP